MRTLSPSIQTQGSTASPSTIVVAVSDPTSLANMKLRVRVCDSAGFATATNATIAPANGCTTLETHTSNKDLTIRSGVATQATGTLTISGVAVDGETVTIGSRVYEFDTSATANITAGRVRVAIDHANAASTVNAQGKLTIAVQPTAGETMTIGTRTYVFVANGTADNPGEISIGANVAAAKLNIVAAINGTDGVNTPNSLVTAAAFVSNDCTITAINGGTAGNSVVFTEALAGSGNVMDGSGVLGGTTAGVNCSASDAATALRAAINSDGASRVAASGTSGSVIVTAKSTGISGNAVPTTETMANGSWSGSTLSGGVNGNSGFIAFTVTNATAETVTLRFGPSLLSPIPDTDYTPTKNLTHA